MIRWRVRAPETAATIGLGRRFGETAPDGAVLLLEGALGAGKTTFAQGVGTGCGVRDPIASPTYNLVLHYAGERPFTHVDLYRLDGPSELETLDLDEVLSSDGVTCIEWPTLVRDRTTPPRAVIALSRDPDGGRWIEGALEGEGWDATIAALEEAGAEIDTV